MVFEAKFRKAEPPEEVERLQKGLKQLRLNPKSSIDQSGLLADLMDCFGGSRALALATYEEFQRSKPGSVARQKILQMIQWLVISTTAREMARVADPSQFSDAELRDALAAYVEANAHAPAGNGGSAGSRGAAPEAGQPDPDAEADGAEAP